MAKDNVDRPDKELQLESLEEPLVMTYVVFNDVLRFVGSVDQAMDAIMHSQDTRDLVLRRVLSDAKKPVEEVEDLIPVEEVGIDIFEVDEVLAWVMEHVTYFFMNQASKMQQRMERFPEMAKQMMTSSDPSSNGSTDSTT